MSNISTRVKEDRFHERRREMQRPKAVKYGFFSVGQKKKVNTPLCENCHKEVNGAGIVINGQLLHNDCLRDFLAKR